MSYKRSYVYIGSFQFGPQFSWENVGMNILLVWLISCPLLQTTQLALTQLFRQHHCSSVCKKNDRRVFNPLGCTSHDGNAPTCGVIRLLPKLFFNIQCKSRFKKKVVASTQSNFGMESRAQKYVGLLAKMQGHRHSFDCFSVFLSTIVFYTFFWVETSQGFDGPGDMLPEAMYTYSFIPDKKINQCDLRDPELEWLPLDDADESTKKLVCWLYNFHVKGGDDRTVCCWEEPVFFVSDSKFETEPWGAQIDVFDVRRQMEGVYSFRLAK